jgi:hypothetical protein
MVGPFRSETETSFWFKLFFYFIFSSFVLIKELEIFYISFLL